MVAREVRGSVSRIGRLWPSRFAALSACDAGVARVRVSCSVDAVGSEHLVIVLDDGLLVRAPVVGVEAVRHEEGDVVRALCEHIVTRQKV